MKIIFEVSENVLKQAKEKLLQSASGDITKTLIDKAYLRCKGGNINMVYSDISKDEPETLELSMALIAISKML